MRSTTNPAAVIAIPVGLALALVFAASCASRLKYAEGG